MKAVKRPSVTPTDSYTLTVMILKGGISLLNLYRIVCIITQKRSLGIYKLTPPEDLLLPPPQLRI